MAIAISTKEGQIHITNEVIAHVAGDTATKCYGVVGMASKQQIKDGIQELLRKENYAKGIVVKQVDHNVVIDLYIIVGYGTKISQVAQNLQQQVKYSLSKTIGVKIQTVNIFIQGVRILAD